VGAGGLQAPAAVLAGVVGVDERDHGQVAGLDAGHLRSGLLDHAEELMTYLTRVVGVRLGLGRPQVAAADGGQHDADHRVGGLADLRILDVLDADVAGLVQKCRAHGVPSFAAFVVAGVLVSGCGGRRQPRHSWVILLSWVIAVIAQGQPA
jgi:hypothetical protein